MSIDVKSPFANTGGWHHQCKAGRSDDTREQDDDTSGLSLVSMPHSHLNILLFCIPPWTTEPQKGWGRRNGSGSALNLILATHVCQGCYWHFISPLFLHLHDCFFSPYYVTVYLIHAFQESLAALCFKMSAVPQLSQHLLVAPSPRCLTCYVLTNFPEGFISAHVVIPPHLAQSRCSNTSLDETTFC